MPKISEFYGIIIAMFYNDHNPPHFHAVYGDHRATFALDDVRLLEGSLPRRAASLVRTWAKIHQHELRREWKLAQDHKPLFRIAPLD
jgi:hypothetical protein